MTLQRQIETDGTGALLTKEGLETAAAQLRLLEGYVADVLREGQDYGVIPGTNTKPTLLKPGAANVIAAFNCYPDPHIETETIDLAQGLVFYRVRVDVLRMDNGLRRAAGQGSCSSYETKYRYRNALAKCPECQKENVRTSKGGGFYCWRNTGGCGANFHHNDDRITTQTIGKVINDDPMEQANTILKMATKRAEVDAALRLPGVARFFTQDLEDMHSETSESEQPQTAPARPSSRAAQPPARPTAPPAAGPTVCPVVGHNSTRMGRDANKRRCHKLADGSFCYGVAPETAPENGGVPPENEGIPHFPDTPLGELQREVYGFGMEWSYFETHVLHMTWPEWVKLNGTVETARTRWHKMSEQREA